MRPILHPRSQTIRLALLAIQSPGSDIDRDAPTGSPEHAAWSARLDAIAFRAAGQPLGDLLMSGGGMPLHVAGHLRRDTWGGRDRVELQIEDAADPRRQS